MCNVWKQNLAPSGCVHIHLSSVGSDSKRISQEQCRKRNTGSHQLWDLLHSMDSRPYSLLSSFDNFSAQSLSKMNPRKPFLRIIFRYIFKAKFSAQTLTLAAKHLQMIPTWGENIGLEVKFGIGSWLGIFGNYVTSMSFASPPPPTDSGFLTLRDVVGKEWTNHSGHSTHWSLGDNELPSRTKRCLLLFS